MVGTRELPAPWGALSFQSLTELRTSGAALLPTLRRLRNLAEEHEAALLDAKARSAQALSQAMLCAVLVPIFGSLLYVFYPASMLTRTSGLWVARSRWVRHRSGPP